MKKSATPSNLEQRKGTTSIKLFTNEQKMVATQHFSKAMKAIEKILQLILTIIFSLVFIQSTFENKADPENTSAKNNKTHNGNIMFKMQRKEIPS